MIFFPPESAHDAHARQVFLYGGGEIAFRFIRALEFLRDLGVKHA